MDNVFVFAQGVNGFDEIERYPLRLLGTKPLTWRQTKRNRRLWLGVHRMY